MASVCEFAASLAFSHPTDSQALEEEHDKLNNRLSALPLVPSGFGVESTDHAPLERARASEELTWGYNGVFNE
jgi:hypothetical protein